MKERAYEDYAKTLNPPCTAKQLKTHIESLRSQHGRITHPTTGKGREDMSDREKWIDETFSFLNTHIVRIPSRSSSSVRQALLILYLFPKIMYWSIFIFF